MLYLALAALPSPRGERGWIDRWREGGRERDRGRNGEREGRGREREGLVQNMIESDWNKSCTKTKCNTSQCSTSQHKDNRTKVEYEV
jgi:hypothetical protein